jgi:hypothetical protein
VIPALGKHRRVQSYRLTQATQQDPLKKKKKTKILKMKKQNKTGKQPTQ